MKRVKLRLERLEGRDAPAVLTLGVPQYSLLARPDLEGRMLIRSAPQARAGSIVIFGGGMDGIEGLRPNHNQTVRRARRR